MSSVKESRKRVAQAYASFNPNELTIRDLLALDRTVLANERTFLSYVRTAVVFGGSGITILKLFPDQPILIPPAYAFIFITPVVFFLGYKRYMRTRKALTSVSTQSEQI